MRSRLPFRKAICRLLGLAVALVIVAGCSGGGPSADTSAGSAADPLDETRTALAEARTAVAEALGNPTGIGLEERLSQRPPSDKLIVITENPAPVIQVRDQAILDAATALGWRVERIPIGTGAEDAAQAFEQALDLNPDAILFSGTPVALLEPQIEKAKDMGVPVLAESVVDPVQDGIISTSLDGTAQVTQYGVLAGQYVAATSDGDAHVAVFTISAYPILTAFVDSFKRTLISACPTCKIVVVNQQLSDLGTKTPQSVVETLKRDPNINWAIFSIGDLTLGVPEALAAAGMQDRVKIGGDAPTAANIAALRSGTEEMWVGFAVTILGWRDIDMLARHFVGHPLDVADQTLLPTQLLTSDNVDTAELDESGYYLGYADYADAFSRLWRLK